MTIHTASITTSSHVLPCGSEQRVMPARSPGFIACIGLAVALLITRADVALAATPVPLGTATSFAVLGGTPGVTNTGLTVVTGDLGVSPAASVTGFPPGIVVGTIHAANAVAASAQFDSAAAYGLLAAQACDVTFAVPTDLAGMTLAPGVYCFASSASNTGLLNLDAGGNTNAVWLFRTASTLITGSGSAVVPINGGQACNVYWQVGSSATLGTGTRFVGSILALTSISVMTGSTLSGRALAQTGAVTLDTSNVSVCSLAPIPPLVMPALAKSFMPNIINAGGLSTLTVTLSNPNPGVATLTTPLVDTLPSGVVIAPLPNGTTTCGGGTTVTATAGGSTVSLPTGRTIPANGSCTISVSVTAPLAGTFLNVLPVNALQTSNGNNPAPANATLTVVAALPSLAKSFMPTSINAGGLSTLTVTLSNLNPTVATLTTPLVDTLPSGVVIAPLPNGTTTCGGGTTVTATAGGSTVSLPTGRTIPANGSCTISVSVTAPLVGTYVNVLPVNALQTSNGNNPEPAFATLIVVAALPPVATPAVPTLSEWMIVILAALMVVVGGIATRRSSR